MLRGQKLILVLLTILGEVVGALGEKETYFRTKSWKVAPFYVKVAHEGDIIRISCQTNNPDVDVSLQRELRPGKFVSIDQFPDVDRRLTISKQEFTWRVSADDQGNYRCVTQSGRKEKFLMLGTLLVNKSPRYVHPKIFPTDKVISLRRGSSEYLTCEAIGSGNPKKTYLGWYRRVGDYLIKIHRSMVRDEGFFQDGLGYDVSTLILRNVGRAASGDYACVREDGYTKTVRRLQLEVDD